MTASGVSQSPEKASETMYTMTGSDDFILIRENQVGVLTLRTGVNRYVKLRGIPILREGEVRDTLSTWISVGDTPRVYVREVEFQQEIENHLVPPTAQSAFGPKEPIEAAVARFRSNARRHIRQIISYPRIAQELNLPASEYKLTTLMNDQNKLAPAMVSKWALKGSYCHVCHAVLLSPNGYTIQALGKLYVPSDKTDDKVIAQLKTAVAVSTEVRRNPMGVDVIVPMSCTSRQNLQKTRLSMPFAEQGSLSSHLNNTFNGVAEFQRAVGFAKYLAQALCAMHESGFYHYDVQANNCLIFGNQLVLCDFGSVVRRDASCEVLATTFPHPLYVLKSPASPVVDIWGFGLVLFRLFHVIRARELELVKHVAYDRIRSDWNALEPLVKKSLHPTDFPIDTVILSALNAGCQASSLPCISMRQVLELLQGFSREVQAFSLEGFDQAVKKWGILQ